MSVLLVEDDESIAIVITAALEAEGFSVSVAPLDGANGETRWHSRQVVISDRLVGRGRCKTALHELAHCQLHRYDRSALATKEVEAESVAWLCVRHLLGEASADEVLGYTGPYLASWSQGNPALVEATAVKGNPLADKGQRLDALGLLFRAVF